MEESGLKVLLPQRCDLWATILRCAVGPNVAECVIPQIPGNVSDAAILAVTVMQSVLTLSARSSDLQN